MHVHPQGPASEHYAARRLLSVIMRLLVARIAVRFHLVLAQDMDKGEAVRMEGPISDKR